MSTATLERHNATSIEWGEWTVRDEGGKGERRHIVWRQERNSRTGLPLTEWHVNARGDRIKYSLAGAEKKAHELNREVAEAKRIDAGKAQRLAEQQAQQDMARQVREVAQCGTQNSEMIARWIIGNFTWTDEVEELREEWREALQSAKNEREAAEETEEQLAKVKERCNALAEEARVLMASLGAYGAPVFADPLEFAAGSTPLEKVVDMSRDLVAALEAYEQEA